MSKAMEDYATANIASGARVLNDGLACLGGFAGAGFKHTVSVTGGGRPKGSDFKWVNTGLGNTKGAITGTCRSCDARHAPRYLASYEYRYNRCFNRPKLVERLAAIATHTGPRPHRFIAAVRPIAGCLRKGRRLMPRSEGFKGHPQECCGLDLAAHLTTHTADPVTPRQDLDPGARLM